MSNNNSKSPMKDLRNAIARSRDAYIQKVDKRGGFSGGPLPMQFVRNHAESAFIEGWNAALKYLQEAK